MKPVRITRASEVQRTARVMQLEGMFDIPPTQRSEVSWLVDLPIHEKDWHVGLIVGPSGAGKSTVARELFGDDLVPAFEWDGKRAIVDGFPAGMAVRDVTTLLSSVGFSSPPSWLRPYQVLSTGEQFRATMARALAEMTELCVMDEFTSVVDRTVAQIGSAAIAKTVRRRNQKFIAVTCHYDVEPWLDPDWVYEPSENRFQWRLLRRRPPISLSIRRVHHSAWGIFKRHHYLTADLNKAATCFCAFIGDRPVAFQAFLPFVGKLNGPKKAMRGHRAVVLPDFQGVGIGEALITADASMWAALNYRVFRPSGHPAEIASASKSPNWRMIRAPSHTAQDSRHGSMGRTMKRASGRLTASFEYVGAAMERAKAVAILGR